MVVEALTVKWACCELPQQARCIASGIIGAAAFSWSRASATQAREIAQLGVSQQVFANLRKSSWSP
jgi:hypothetical protein